MPKSTQHGRPGAGRRNIKRREPVRRPVPSVSNPPSSPLQFGAPRMAVPPSPVESKAPVPLRSYVSSDLKRIGIIAALMFVILIVLAIVL